MKILKIQTVFLGALLIATGSSFQEVRACGDFSLPRPHFEGVSEGGHVSHWEQLGSLDLGDIKIPLTLGFQTYLPYGSKELGAGWILPIFDSNIVQRDEGTFDMVQPDGWMGLFRRDGENPNILHGSGGMLAEIRGDTITVNFTCSSGWKMVFIKGKLTSLRKGDHTLNIVRDELGCGVAVKDGPKVVLTLEQDQKTGLAKNLVMGDKKIDFAYDAKPRVESVAGVNLVGGVEPSLHKITYSDGKSESFDFAVTDKLLPDLKITGSEGKERMIVWDTSNHIVRDGEWSYSLSELPNPGEVYAAIGRTNQSGQSEFWHKDDAKGEETTQGLDGVKTIETWFTSGVLSGKERKLERIQPDGKKETLEEYAYDEKGEMLRSNIYGFKTLYARDISKFKATLTNNATMAIQRNPNGEIERILSSSSDTSITKKGNSEVITTSTASGTLTRILDAQGRLISIVATQYKKP
jgi:hypothetical protein